MLSLSLSNKKLTWEIFKYNFWENIILDVEKNDLAVPAEQITGLALL